MAVEAANPSPNPSETLREEETASVASVLIPEDDGVGLDLSGPAAASGTDSVSEKKEEEEAIAAPVVATTASEKEESEGKEKTLESKEVSVDVLEKEERAEVDERKVPLNLGSFKEESNLVCDLLDSERKALEELKQLVQAAIDNNEFIFPSSKIQTSSTEAVAASQAEGATSGPVQEELSIWGIPLLKDDRNDVILLKFLRARDFKVKDAFVMIKNTIKWRKEFNVDGLLEEDLGDDLEKVVFMHGHDREGHPVCYNVYGEFQNKELYEKTFGDEDKRNKFLRWRIQFLERSIRKLDFRPGGVSTIFQVNDLKNSPGPGKRELRLATKQALQLLQDNYPEFVAKQVFINVPWWYLAFYTILIPFLTPRTKSKFVFAGPSKSADTLLKYISPEQLLVQYGGLSVDFCDCHPEFTISDPVAEVPVKPNTKQIVEIIIYEKCIIVWELRVVGWEVSCGVEFVPDVKNSYTIIIQKPTKLSPADEPVISSSFKVNDLGKLLLTIDNPTSKKKRLLYRFKIEPLSG